MRGKNKKEIALKIPGMASSSLSCFVIVISFYMPLASILNHRVIWICSTGWDGMHDNTELAACSLSGPCLVYLDTQLMISGLVPSDNVFVKCMIH